VKPAVAFTQPAPITNRPRSEAMSQTFDIRFTKATGLAALFEAPHNGPRWKGIGTLTADAEGIRVGKRGSSQKIDLRDVASVYRESEALRIEFTRGEAVQSTLRIWAGSAAAAAEIVKLLPTTNSVESEESAHTGRVYRIDWWVAASLGVVIVGGIVIWSRTSLEQAPPSLETREVVRDQEPVSGEDAPVGNTKASQAPPWARSSERANRTATSNARPPRPMASPTSPRDDTLIDSAPNRAEESVERIEDARSFERQIEPEALAVPALTARDFAVQELAIFEGEMSALRDDYVAGKVSTTELHERWWQVTVRIHNTPEFQSSTHCAQRELELAISRSWRRTLPHASAVRQGDTAYRSLATEEMAFAEMLAVRLRDLVY
jgi:hypothetical protein